jgi:hypothetical protein
MGGLIAIGSEEESVEIIQKLVAYLVHPYPKVRQTSSEVLYTAVATMNLDVEDLLISTNWYESQDAKDAKQEIARVLNTKFAPEPS